MALSAYWKSVLAARYSMTTLSLAEIRLLSTNGGALRKAMSFRDVFEKQTISRATRYEKVRCLRPQSPVTPASIQSWFAINDPRLLEFISAYGIQAIYSKAS